MAFDRDSTSSLASDQNEMDVDYDDTDLMQLYNKLMLSMFDITLPLGSQPMVTDDSTTVPEAGPSSQKEGMNAKKRKMEKKKLKREESKKAKEGLVEEIGEPFDIIISCQKCADFAYWCDYYPAQTFGCSQSNL